MMHAPAARHEVTMTIGIFFPHAQNKARGGMIENGLPRCQTHTKEEAARKLALSFIPYVRRERFVDTQCLIESS